MGTGAAALSSAALSSAAADNGNVEDALFRIFIPADIHRVWREPNEQDLKLH